MASINLPAGRNLSQEYSQTLSAQMGIMPNLLAAQAQYQPVQSGNTLQNLNYLMLGTPDQSYTSQVYSPAVYDKGGTYSYGPLPQDVMGAIQYPSLPDQTNFPQSTPWYQKIFGGGGGGGIPGLPGIGGGGIPGISGGGIGGGIPGVTTGTGTTTPGAGTSSYPGIPAITAGTGTTTPGGGQTSFPNFTSIGGIPGISGGGIGIPGLPGGGGGGGGGILGGILGPLGGLFGGGGSSGPPKVLVSPSGYQTVTHTLPAQQGLLSLYQNYIAPSQEAIASGQRASDIGDVMNLGPAALASIAASDPGTAGLIQNATNTVGAEYGMGANLDPSLMRMAQQAVRQRQQGMLGGTGSAGDLAEALGISQFGQGLRQQRLANLGNVVGLRQGFYGDPFQRVLGRPGTTSVQNTVGQAGGLASQGTASNLLNPESSYAQDVYSGNWNALVNQAIGNANNQNALIGAGISAIGGLAGGALGAI